MLVEVTGCSGSGKSYLLSKISGRVRVYPAVKNKIISLLFGLISIAILPFLLRPVEFCFLLTTCSKSDKYFINRINVFRNVSIKFVRHFFINRYARKSTIYVDEGISHIPFILQLNPSTLKEFYILFEDYLKKMVIVFVRTDEKRNFSRLMNRGHWRFARMSDSQKKKFFNINKDIEKNYIKSVSNKFDFVMVNSDVENLSNFV